jgi:hypothetical protein
MYRAKGDKPIDASTLRRWLVQARMQGLLSAGDMLRRRDQAHVLFPWQAMSPLSREGLANMGTQPLARYKRNEPKS